MTATPPRPLLAAEKIRIGTLYGRWDLVLAQVGRGPLCTAGYYLEYRPVDGPYSYGLGEPTIGVDAAGVCAAVRLPLAPPAPPPVDPLERAAALLDLAERVEAAFSRRVAAIAGSAAEWTYRIARSTALLAAIQAATATEAERAELADLLEIQAQVQAARMYAWLPTTPAMWGPEPSDMSATLYGWAEASSLDAAGIAAIDADYPPVAAPQWPAG